MKLILEKTTGKLVPDGVAAELPKGGEQPIEIQFLDSGVAGLLPDGTAISLDAYAPDDLENPVLTVADFQADAARKLYTAMINTLAGAIAWLQKAVWIANITYGATTSGNFHLNYGGGGESAPSAQVKVIVPPPGPKNFPVSLSFAGDLVAGQPFGSFKPKQDGRVVAVQLSLQDAPTGADAKVAIVKNDVVQAEVTTLTAGNKQAAADLATALQYVAGDVLRGQITQIGSTLPGAWLTVNLICQTLAEDDE